jgi:hypothetical protein
MADTVFPAVVVGFVVGKAIAGKLKIEVKSQF